jgi:hypothetical protein
VIFVGIDWAERHHDVCVLADDGQLLAATRIDDGVAGVSRLHALLATYTDDPAAVVVGIETDRGLLVGALVAAGYRVHAINPLAASRYRERHTTSRAKSDRGDARVLPRGGARRPPPSPAGRRRQRPGRGGQGPGPSHQSLIWTRQRQVNALRSALREFYPGALAALGTELAHPEALAVLGAAPTPTHGQRLTPTELAGLLAGAGRQRNLARRAHQLHQALTSPQLIAPPAAAAAYGQVVAATVGVIGELYQQITTLEQELTRAFDLHPDAESCAVCPDSAWSAAPWCWRSSGTTRPAMATYRPQGLRRHRAHHPFLGHPSGRRGPRGPQQAPGRCLLPVGLRRAFPLDRRPGLLRPAPRARRHPPPGPARPWQPAGRRPARPPAPPQQLRRAPGLGPPCATGRGLTPSSRRMARA